MRNYTLAKPGKVFFRVLKDGPSGYVQQPGNYAVYRLSRVPTQTRTRRPYSTVLKKTGPLPPFDANYFKPWSYTKNRAEGRDGYNYEGNIYGFTKSELGHVAGVYDMSGFISNSLVARTTLYNECVSKLNEKIRGSLDLSVDALQFRQTSRMFQSLTPRAITRTLSDLVRKGHVWHYVDDKRGRPRLRRFDRGRDWREAFRAPSGAYLQYKYGISPLMSSVWETVGQSMEVAQKHLRGFSASHWIPTPGSGTDGGTAAIQVLTGKQIVKIGVVMDADVMTSPASLEKYTSLNPIAMGYELIPYSFVLDWFIDIGSFLRDVESGIFNRRAFVNGYSVELTYFDWKSAQNYKSGFNHGSWSGVGSYSEYDRKVLTAPPVPYLPRFKMDLGSSRLLSAAALMAQFLKR